MNRKKAMKKLVCSLVAICLAFSLSACDKEDFEAVPPTVDTSKMHIACIGDSITFGAGVVETKDTESYPAYLQGLVGDNYQTLNYGICGRTLLSSGDMPYVKDDFYQLSQDVKAKIYIIMLGTNDTKSYNWDAEKYEEELTDFVKLYQSKQEKPCVYLMQPPKAFEVDGKVGYDIDAEIVEGELYDIIGRVADKTGCGLIDLYSLTENHSDWYVDGVHPNAEGNKNIADCIYQSIKENL